MLISYNRPPYIVASLIGEGATWLSDDNCRAALERRLAALEAVD